MSDLYEGGTMTYAAKFISDGAAHTFTLPFQADCVKVYNYTKWSTVSNIPCSIWFRGFPAGDALQWNVIADNGSTGEENLLLETTNGFTVADTSGGATAYRAAISGITQADPGVVTTSAAHGLSTGDLVRLTQLGDAGAVSYGMDQLNNGRFKVVVLTSTTFSLQDPITGDDIDTTGYVAYSSGGKVNLITRVDSQQFAYDPVTYRLTFGSAVMGADGDVLYFEAIKYGQGIEDLGDIT